jgi:hypothetical protein
MFNEISLKALVSNSSVLNTLERFLIFIIIVVLKI